MADVVSGGGADAHLALKQRERVPTIVPLAHYLIVVNINVWPQTEYRHFDRSWAVSGLYPCADLPKGGDSCGFAATFRKTPMLDVSSNHAVIFV